MPSDDPAARVGANIRAMLESLGSDEERARALLEADHCVACGGRYAHGSWIHCPRCWGLHASLSKRSTGATTKG